MIFEDYVKMIRHVSWQISKKYGIEYFEVEAQGFYIYCLALKSFDIKKSTFSTYLFIQLWGRLKDFGEKYKRWNAELADDSDSFLLNAESKDYELKNNFLERAKNYLDEMSFDVLNYILSFEWFGENHRKPTVVDIMHKFGCGRKRANKLWNNCNYFWKNIA
jgi:hypothetical protein